MKKKEIIYPACANPKVPQPLKPAYHAVPLQMRFNDIDMVGHLNNSVYITFFDLGKVEYFRSVFPEGVNWHHIPLVVVNINCNFYSPTYLDEPIEVTTAVTAMSERSLKMEQRIVNRETGDVKCVAQTVMAGFDPKTATGAQIDPKWRDAITVFERNE